MLHLGSHCSPDYLWNASRIRNEAVRPFTVSILDPANNPRRLVTTNDDSGVSSFSYPYATLLDGIRSRVLRDRLSFPLHGLMVSRNRGESASPLHLRDRNHTCTKLKLSKTSRSLSPIPDCKVISGERVAVIRFAMRPSGPPSSPAARGHNKPGARRRRAAQRRPRRSPDRSR